MLLNFRRDCQKGEKNRLESWPFRGQPLVSSSLRQRQVVGEPEEESEGSEHALLAEMREAKKLEQEDESEEGLGGYDYNVLSDSLALRPVEFDVKESNNNVLSLMSSMHRRRVRRHRPGRRGNGRGV